MFLRKTFNLISYFPLCAKVDDSTKSLLLQSWKMLSCSVDTNLKVKASNLLPSELLTVYLGQWYSLYKLYVILKNACSLPPTPTANFNQTD